MTGVGGQDTFVFNKGYGILEVRQDDSVYSTPPTLANVLQFGPGISLPQLKVSATAAGDLVLVLANTGDIVKLDGEVGPDTSVSLGVQKVAFADGSSVTRQQLNSLAQSDPLFDAGFYRARNPDVVASGFDPYLHYLTYGWREGRNPNALFDTNYYLAQNPDVRAAGLDPLLHFESNGRQEGREPSLLFSDAKYLAANPDVAAAGINPLVHYLSYGQAEGRMAFLPGGTATADPLVNAAYYDKQLGATLIPAGVAGQQQAAASYDATGWQKGLNPDAFFDTGYYLAHNPDVAAAHVNPLTQYETIGWKQGRDPSAQFSTNKYLAAYSDVKAAGLDPLLHYVAYDQAEGRTAFAA